MGWMSTADAALALGLDRTEVEALVRARALDAAHGTEGGWLLDPDEVRALLLERQAARRPSTLVLPPPASPPAAPVPVAQPSVRPLVLAHDVPTVADLAALSFGATGSPPPGGAGEQTGPVTGPDDQQPQAADADAGSGAHGRPRAMEAGAVADAQPVEQGSPSPPSTVERGEERPPAAGPGEGGHERAAPSPSVGGHDEEQPSVPGASQGEAPPPSVDGDDDAGPALVDPVDAVDRVDPVERGRLAARVILALEDQIDELTEAVREAALALAASADGPPDARHIGAVLGVAPTAVDRLLGTDPETSTSGPETGDVAPPPTDHGAHDGDEPADGAPLGAADREAESDEAGGDAGPALDPEAARGCLGALLLWLVPRPRLPLPPLRLPLPGLLGRLFRR